MHDLFDFASPKDLREETRFGEMDARTGLPAVNSYSTQLAGERAAAYAAGHVVGRAKLCEIKEKIS